MRLRLGTSVLPATALILITVTTFEWFHGFAQTHHAGLTHPYLDGSRASTVHHIAHVGPSWLATALGAHGGGNNGWVDTPWNERWMDNFLDIANTSWSEPMQDLPEVDAEPAPTRGFVSMSRRDAEETAASIRIVMDKMRAWWLVEPGSQARIATVDRLDRLATCLEDNTCKRGETTVVIGASHHFGWSYGGSVGGEDIWARSVCNATNDLGHTLLFADHALEAASLYAAIPHLVAVVILEAEQLNKCAGLGVPVPIRQGDLDPGHQQGMSVSYSEAMRIRRDLGLSDDEPEKEGEIWGWRGMYGIHKLQEHNQPIGCMKRRGHPTGIPLWKTFSFNFWNSADHPLGRAWTLAPEDYGHYPRAGGANNFYLGYSIERVCRHIKTVPSSERKQRAFILAKEARYFDPDWNLYYTENGTFQRLSQETGLGFVATAGWPPEQLNEAVVENLGRQDREAFHEEVAHSLAMIGIGQPRLSPTPYESLCLGVPFINPVHQWYSDDEHNRNGWETQHNGLVDVHPPAVYHVHMHDIDGLANALKAAAENHIDRFIHPRMTAQAMADRMQTLINLDWKTLFRKRVGAWGWEPSSSVFLF